MSKAVDVKCLLARVKEMSKDILRLADEHQEECEKFLRMAGWEYTCTTPGSVWLWTKRITVRRTYGGVPQERAYDALCTQEMAISLTRRMMAEALNDGRDCL